MENPATAILMPSFVKFLTGLKGVLKKGEDFAKEKNVTADVFLNSRIAIDMFDLKKQVQVACDNAKGSLFRLAGKEVPSFADTETTFAELYARIDKTLELIATLKEEDFTGAMEREIRLAYFPGQHMKGKDYMLEYVLPNFFFHVTTAYDILRHLGVDLGKTDFMGGSLPLNDD